jgi:AraC-like DNA-binding protein
MINLWSAKLPRPPLEGHESFAASTVGMLVENIALKLGGTMLAADDDWAFAAHANYFALPHTELWFCSYDIPVKLSFEAGQYVRVQFHYAGAGATFSNGRHVTISPDQACISSGAATIDFGPQYQQVVWRIPQLLITRKIAELTGLPVIEPIRFEPALNLMSRQYDTLTSLLMCTLEKIALAAVRPNQFVLAELEQAMLVALLCQSDHNYRHLLDNPRSVAVPWQVRRIEQYIEENLQRDLSIKKIAEETGCSTRTIFRAFQEFRGYSPREFLKRARLQRAKSIITDPNTDHSLETIALACGFMSASQLSKDFSRHFGQPPSKARR